MARPPVVPALRTTTRTVLYVSNHGEIVGGGELSLLDLVAALDRARWTPIVVVPAEGEVADRCRALGVAAGVVPLPRLRRPHPEIVRSVVALRSLARDRGAVLLHANGSRAMVYAGLAGRLGRRPVIWHVRVADRDRLLDRLLVRLASAVIVNSEAVGRRLGWAPPGKVRSIPNGVDLARFAPRPLEAGSRRSLGLPEGGPVVASVGRFVPYKGYAHLVEAAALVARDRPDAHWLLVGDGEQRGELERRCRALGLGGTIHFTGWRQDVPEILAASDVFVMPSLGEHFGRVLVEAMAMGKPVVATDAGGTPEIVLDGETGLLVPPAEPEPLARAVLALLNDGARAQRLGAAGRRRAEARFSLARHAAAVEALYDEVLA